MPCFHPIPAWKGKRVGASGKRPIAFKFSDGFKDFPVEVPCGKCTGCIQDRANEWALRCEHEAKCHEFNWFLTLTYDESNVPVNGSLELSHLQDFWKRVRKCYGSGVRYFAVGEYGEQLERPHYHALVFNLLPPDLVKRSRLNGKVVFESESLSRLWANGIIQIDSFSPAAAQYVTNYIRKKVTGRGASSHYGVRAPEFQVMSRRPGIGKFFLARFMHDIYPDGYVTRAGGSPKRAPRFYDLTLEKVNARLYRKMKRKRIEVAKLDVDKHGSRLYTLHEVAVERNKFFDGVKGRPYERGQDF